MKARVIRLENTVQPYAWGSLTAIPELLGVPPTGAPQAELWIGAHPLAPSTAGGVALSALVSQRPDEMLGAAVVARFGASLPFLLKVLAAAQPLSLQAHPSRAQAAAGFAREEAAGVPRSAPHRTYKDPNHKPELICALTPFKALCGFRDTKDSLRFFHALACPALAPLIDTLQHRGLRAAFELVMTMPEGPRLVLVSDTVEACRTRAPKDFAAECVMASSLAERYPGDAGVIGALLLNLVELKPGQALALGAGNLHAYLEGTGIELMANSDNVLRGGLTPKHVDVAELVHVLDFAEGPATVLEPRGAPEAVYVTPFPDFRLSRLVPAGAAVTLERWGPELWLCVDGQVELNGAPLPRGASAFSPFADGPTTVSGTGTAFRATINR